MLWAIENFIMAYVVSWLKLKDFETIMPLRTKSNHFISTSATPHKQGVADSSASDEKPLFVLLRCLADLFPGLVGIKNL